MIVPTQYDLDKALMSMAIKSALLDFRKDAYDDVVKRLDNDGFFIHDCFDHPEYFSKILNEQFGLSYTKIINAIHVWLGDSSSNKLISKFLVSALKKQHP